MDARLLNIVEGIILIIGIASFILAGYVMIVVSNIP